MRPLVFRSLSPFFRLFLRRWVALCCVLTRLPAVIPSATVSAAQGAPRGPAARPWLSAPAAG